GPCRARGPGGTGEAGGTGGPGRSRETSQAGRTGQPRRTARSLVHEPQTHEIRVRTAGAAVVVVAVVAILVLIAFAAVHHGTQRDVLARRQQRWKDRRDVQLRHAARSHEGGVPDQRIAERIWKT